MQLIVFLLIYPLLWLISILPFRLFYLFSNFIYFIIYHIIGYRKKTVRENIALALPHLSYEERLVIEKNSFSHLCDMFLEMIKTMSISEKEMDERFQFKNLDVYLDLEKKGKSIALVCAHYASYEWVVSMNKNCHHDGIAIYKKIANRHFDELVKKIRSKFKARLITTKEVTTVMEENHKNNRLAVYGLASDQSPKINANTYWRTFMGIEVPVHTGAEILAKKYDMNVIFLKVKKVKRGFYEAEFEVLSEDVKSVPNYEIMDAFVERVEKQILEEPSYYMWTHKRFKHRKL
jgi:KDO2-lipid IV(A) lauroyltransferase